MNIIKILGTRLEAIKMATLVRILDDSAVYSSLSASPNPYGKGIASQRILSCLLSQQFVQP